MTQEELNELKVKADSGDVEACADYALALYEQKTDDDSNFLLAWKYARRCCHFAEGISKIPQRLAEMIFAIYMSARETDNKIALESKYELSIFYHCYVANNRLKCDDDYLLYDLFYNSISIYWSEDLGFLEEHKEWLNVLLKDALTFYDRLKHDQYCDRNLRNNTIIEGEASYLLSLVERDEVVKKQYLLKAIEYHCDKAIDEFLLSYINNVYYSDNELKLVKTLINNRSGYQYAQDMIDAFICLQSKEFNGLLQAIEKINIPYSRYRQDFEGFVNGVKIAIYYYNLIGDSFDIGKAKSLANFFNSKVQDEIENQEQLDVEQAQLGGTMIVDPLMRALRNTNDLIFKDLKELLRIHLSDEQKNALSNINIEFSYDRKKDVYAPTKEDIFDYIKEIEKLLSDVDDDDLRKQFEDVLKILKTYLKEKDFDEGARKIAQSMNMELLLKYNRRLAFMIRDLSNFVKTSTSVTYGEYSNSEKKITLYLVNIYEACKDPKDYLKKEIFLLTVYAHEMFHAFHYLTMNNSGTSSNNKKDIDSIVKESLASYFEYQFAMRNFHSHGYFNNSYPYSSTKIKYYKEVVAERTMQSWTTDMFIYPYSGAKYMKRQDDLDHNDALFRMVYEKSINSMKAAFDLLDFFYKLEMD